MRFLQNESVVKVMEAKVIEYDQRTAFEQGYHKVLRKDQRVIIKFVRLDEFNENEINCSKKLGKKSLYHVLDHGVHNFGHVQYKMIVLQKLGFSL